MADDDHDTMLEVSAAELNRRFGEVRRRAISGPVGITYHGRRSLILLALDEYERLRGSVSDADLADGYRRRLSVLMDHVTEGYFAIGRDWRIEDCNRTAELFVGRTREELIGRSFDEAFPTSRLDLEPVRRAMDFGEVIHIERASLIHPDRRLTITAFPLPGPGGGVGSLFSNVTERARLLATIKGKDSAIAHLLAENPDRLIFMLNDRGEVEHWGAGGETILGWTADDVLARPVGRILADDQSHWLQQDQTKALQFKTRGGEIVRASGKIQSLGPSGALLFMLSPDA